MNILNKISLKNLKLNKKRTISTILGIILSCALICATATLGTSFQETLVENAINETGYYHLKLLNVNDNDIEELQNNRDIDKIYATVEKGYAKLDDSQNEYKPYVKLYSMAQETFDFLKFNLVEGTFPRNENEVVISQHIIDNAKVDYQIGDTIKIDVGQRQSIDGYKLYDSNSYYEGEEELINTQEYEFTIVGIMERPNYSFEKRSDPGYTIVTTGIDSENKDVYISLKNPKNYESSIEEIFDVSDYKAISTYNEDTNNLKYSEYELNNELLRWEAFAFSDSTVAMLYAVIGVVIFIIIFTSVFCIRNSFAISVTEKVKMYGMLSSIGATKKQIKKSVIFEALIIGLIGIPLGILSGIFADFVLIKIVNLIIGDYLLTYVDGIIVKVSIIPILLSVILGLLTIYLSAISSARKASKITPMESLRNSEEIKIKSKSLKTPKIISKLFKTGGVLAYKNLKRSKKKYKTTVISLTISIFIFITMNSFVANMFDLSSTYYKNYDYNIILYGVEDDKINKVASLEDVDDYFILYRDSENELKITDESKLNDFSDIISDYEYYYEDLETGEMIGGGSKIAMMQLVALDDQTFRKYCKKLNIDYNDVKSKGILCDETYADSNIVRRYKYMKGDTITGFYNDTEVNIEVGAVSDVKPYGMENWYYDGGFLILNLEEYSNDFYFTFYMMTLQSSNTQAVIEQIQELDSNISSTDLEESIREERAMILVIKIFLYGFIAIISLIGVTNIFNTITSNMELRQKEFAMLKSIGMTKKEFNRMINLETILYSTKALLYGTILGLLGTFALYKATNIKIDLDMYIPIEPIIISIIFVFILVFIIMRYSINKINKQNIIETIRKDNI